MKINAYKISLSKIPSRSFKGNQSYENSSLSSTGLLNHETYFFRENKTDKFVQDYIIKHFFKKPEINIVSAGCSSGEEAFSYYMMLDFLSEKIKITGFDIDEKSIEKAKKGEFEIQIPYKKHPIYEDEYPEMFLIQDDKGLSRYKKICRDKFHQYFVLSKIEDNKKDKNSFFKRIKNAVSNFLKPQGDRTEAISTYYFKLKQKNNSNPCFIKGDILNTKDMFKKGSVDIFLYRNALYHQLCTVDKYANFRYMKPECRETLKKIILQVKDILSDDGLIVFGEKEYLQGINTDIIYDTMQECGFEPVIADKKEYDEIKSKRNSANSKEIDTKLKELVHIWKKPKE